MRKRSFQKQFNKDPGVQKEKDYIRHGRMKPSCRSFPTSSRLPLPVRSRQQVTTSHELPTTDSSRRAYRRRDIGISPPPAGLKDYLKRQRWHHHHWPPLAHTPLPSLTEEAEKKCCIRQNIIGIALFTNTVSWVVKNTLDERSHNTPAISHARRLVASCKNVLSSEKLEPFIPPISPGQSKVPSPSGTKPKEGQARLDGWPPASTGRGYQRSTLKRSCRWKCALREQIGSTAISRGAMSRQQASIHRAGITHTCTRATCAKPTDVHREEPGSFILIGAY